MSGSVLGNRAFDGMPGRPRLVDAACRSSSAAVRRDGSPRVADAQLVQRRCSRTCAGSSRRTTRTSVCCGPSVPVVTPLPSGSGVTGTKSSWNRVSRPNTWSRFAGQSMVDPDAELILIDAFRCRRGGSCWPSRRSSAADTAPAARARPDRSAPRESCCPGTGVRVTPPSQPERSWRDRKWPGPVRRSLR